MAVSCANLEGSLLGLQSANIRIHYLDSHRVHKTSDSHEEAPVFGVQEVVEGHRISDDCHCAFFRGLAK